MKRVFLIYFILFSITLFAEYNVLVWDINDNNEIQYRIYEKEDISFDYNNTGIKTTIVNELPSLSVIASYDALFVIDNAKDPYQETIDRESRDKIERYLLEYGGNLYIEGRYIYSFCEYWFRTLLDKTGMNWRKLDIRKEASNIFYGNKYPWISFNLQFVQGNTIETISSYSLLDAESLLQISENRSVMIGYKNANENEMDYRVIISSLQISDVSNIQKYSLIHKIITFFGYNDELKIKSIKEENDLDEYVYVQKDSISFVPSLQSMNKYSLIDVETPYIDSAFVDSLEKYLNNGGYVLWNIKDNFYTDSIVKEYIKDNLYFSYTMVKMEKGDILYNGEKIGTFNNNNNVIALISDKIEKRFYLEYEKEYADIAISYHFDNGGILVVATVLNDSLKEKIYEEMFGIKLHKKSRIYLKPSYKINDSKISLSWAINKDDNTYMWLINRKVENEMDFIPIGSIKKEKNKYYYKYEDMNIEKGQKYVYKISRITSEGDIEEISREIIVEYKDKQEKELPYKIYSNPFTNNFYLSYSLEDDAKVLIAVYDVSGKKLKTLTEGSKSSGEYSVNWDGKDDKGQVLPRNIYFLRIQIGDSLYREKIMKVE